MKVLLGYRDIMELGVSKKTAYKMLNLICESEAYKKSNLSKVIDTKKVPTKLFIRMFPEFKERCEQHDGCRWFKRVGWQPFYWWRWGGRTRWVHLRRLLFRLLQSRKRRRSLVLDQPQRRKQLNWVIASHFLLLPITSMKLSILWQ